MQNEGFPSGEQKATQQEMENRERVNRFNFRYRVRSVIGIVDFAGSALPNKPRVKQLLEEALKLVPPFSEREEEWLERELQIDQENIVPGSDEDVEWQEKHPRH